MESLGALAGVRVVDLLETAGHYGVRLLRGFGAEIIRVEPPGGSTLRQRWPVATKGPSPEVTPWFAHYYAGTKSVTLDVTTESGRATLLRLIDNADIVLDNGHLSDWGFDLEAITGGERPRVVVSLTPFGLEGARSHWLGSDLICQAMSGMVQLFGHRDDRPARFGMEQASELGGLAVALGALIAHYGTQHGIGGDVVDISMERVCALVTFQMSNASMFHQFGFTKNRTPGDEAGSVVQRASDGYVSFGAWRDVEVGLNLLEEFGEGEGLRALRESLGDAAFQRDPRAVAAVRRFVVARTRTELEAIAQPRGVMALSVNDAADLVADPFLQSRGSIVEVTLPGIFVPLPDTGAPVRMGATPFVAGGRVPVAGGDNDAVLGVVQVRGDR